MRRRMAVGDPRRRGACRGALNLALLENGAETSEQRRHRPSSKFDRARTSRMALFDLAFARLAVLALAGH